MYVHMYNFESLELYEMTWCISQNFSRFRYCMYIKHHQREYPLFAWTISFVIAELVCLSPHILISHPQSFP